jgi:inositol-phosphate transport system permease protein
MGMGKILRYVVFAALCIIVLSPIGSIVWLSLSSDRNRLSTELTLNYYEFILSGWLFQDPVYQKYYPNIYIITLNTLFLAGAVTVLFVIISSMTGYVLSRYKIPARGTILGFFLVLHGFPTTTLIISLYFILKSMNLLNSLWGVVLARLTVELPLGVWVMKGFYDSVPWDVEMASLVDGAGRLKTWWHVILPAVKPGIAAISIFAFTAGWSEFIFVYTFILDRTTWTLSNLIRGLMGELGTVSMNLIAALAMFYTLPILVFFIFTQKYLLKVALGGVKG